jgi:hypothetical protein
MKTILLPALLWLALMNTNKLVGRWESISPTGNVTGVVFKEDNSFEGYVNNKPFVSGTYTLRDSTFEMQDNGCMGATGSYILHFFSKGDSFRIELVNDHCEGRANGTNNRVFGRVK